MGNSVRTVIDDNTNKLCSIGIYAHKQIKQRGKHAKNIDYRAGL